MDGDDMPPGLDDGSLSVGMRLKRIEDALVAVLGKFEVVAAHADVEILRTRVESIERDGSPPTQRIAVKVDVLELRIDVLETKVASDEAAQIALRNQRRWYLGTVIALLSASGGLQAFFALVHH